MAINAWDLIDTNSFKGEAMIDLATNDVAQTALIELLAGAATGLIERYCNRHFIPRTAGDYTEYHTFLKPRDNFWTLEAPIISITDIHESLDRDYDSADLLVTSVDYVPEKRYGRIWRVTGANPMFWQLGVRVVRLRYKAGFATRADLPMELVKQVRQTSVRLYREVSEKMQGFGSRTDMSGYVARFASKVGGVCLDESMKMALKPWRREPSSTGTNDDITV